MDGVKVQSVDALRLLRVALCKFADSAKAVLSEADGELQKAVNWVQTEADSHWQGQIRSRQAGVVKAKEALRAKKLYSPTGAKPSVVDEEKAVRVAIARLQEAEGKLVAVHKYSTLLQKEVMQYKGQAQRFTNSVTIDIPIAVGKLDAMLRDLEAYLGVKVDEGAGEELRVQGSGFSTEGAEREGRGTMVRAAEEGESGGGGEGENGGSEKGEVRSEKEGDGCGAGAIHNSPSEIRNPAGGG